MICTAPLKAWQTTERGLRQSRTPHARSSCIIGNFLTIAWGTETLAIGDSQVRSYDRRTVRSGLCARKLQALYHKRPTDGSEPTTVGCSVERGSQWRCKDRCLRSTFVGFKPFRQTSSFLGEAQNKTPQHKTPNCQPLRSFSPVKPVVNRLRHQQIHAKVKRTGSLIRPGICAFCLTAGRNPAQVRLAILLAFHGAVQIISRSSPTHDLERRLVQFLRLHRATLGLLSCLIPEGCGPDAAGFSGPYSSVLCHPFERHCCRPSALDTSTTALTARKSTSCSIMGLSLGDRRSFGPLSCTYVISFPGPHSEPPVISVSPVHRDRHSRPARAPVYAPAHLPSHAASPITQTPARSKSARLCAPRGGCCRFVLRSAGFSR